jgi:hypothetical protein
MQRAFRHTVRIQIDGARTFGTQTPRPGVGPACLASTFRHCSSWSKKSRISENRKCHHEENCR